MRTITCFGDQTTSTFLIIPSVSLAKITQSHGPITLWLWMFSTVLHLLVLPEIETCKERRINRWNYRSPYLQYHLSNAGHFGWLYQVTFMALMYRSIPKPPIPPPGKPRGIWLFRKNLVKFPAMLPVRRSNAPPVRASKRVKSPTLQAC